MRIRVDIKTVTQTQLPQLWMHKEDKDTDIFGWGVRDCAVGGCPAVMVLKEPNLKTNLDKNWQYFLWAINMNMTIEDVALIMDWRLAFCNQTGLRNPNQPRRNYLEEKDLTAVENDKPAYPRLDKDRTCSRNFLAGREVGEFLELDLFDGNLPPPMKPGKTLPQRLEDVRLEDYLYNPKDHPWRFCVANRVTTKPGNQTSVAPFPRGGFYSWTGDNLPYTFVPHVSREKIQYPKKYLTKLDMSKPLPSRYRIVTT